VALLLNSEMAFGKVGDEVRSVINLFIDAAYMTLAPLDLSQLARGFGIFALSKNEWDGMGGMNTEQFGSTYGGEDWDFFDR
jgi:hypothetical protein